MRPLEFLSPPSFPLEPNRLSSNPALAKGQPRMWHEFLLVIGLVTGRCLSGEAPRRRKQMFQARRPSGSIMLFPRPSAPDRSSRLSLSICFENHLVASQESLPRPTSPNLVRAVWSIGHRRGPSPAEP
jgi:hypothetical protein